jgi:hypothetical protein
MRIGTSYFVSRNAAIHYYFPFDTTAAVDRKIAAGEIHIGKPDRPLGCRLIVIDDGRRYAIEEIPNNSNVRECDNCDNFVKCVGLEMCQLGDLPAGESE